MKKIIFIIIAIIVIGGLWWGVSNKKTVQNTNPIRVGVAVDQTGYAATWGDSELKATELALDAYRDKINQPVELVVENTKGTDVGTVNAVKKLIEIDHVQVILGPTWADSFQGAMPIAGQAKVVLLSPSAAVETIKDKDKFSYFFSTWWPEESEIKTLIDYMKSLGVTKFSPVNDQDPFNSQFVDTLVATINSGSSGITVSSRDTVPIGTKDFRTIIAKIKSIKPSATFIQLQDTSLMGPFMKQLKEQNVNALVFGTPDAENTDNITKFPGAFDGILYTFPSYDNDPSYKVLLDKLYARFGADTSRGPSFVSGYNAATMLFEVLKDGARTGTEIRDALNKVHVPGVGVKDLSFSQKGQLKDVTFIMKTIRNNKFELVK